MSGDTEQKIADAIKGFLVQCDAVDVPVHIDTISDLQHGDVTTNIAFLLAKRLKKTPVVIAQELADFLAHQNIVGVDKVVAAGAGFVNITFNGNYYAQLLSEIFADGDAYGTNTKHAGEVWAIEHTSPNPNKAMHLGHLRNNLVGMSVGHILEWSGATVIYEAVDNNRGIAIAKLMWGFLAHMKKNADVPTDISYWATHQEEWYTPEDRGVPPDIFVSECYILGDKDCKDPDIENKVRELVVRWEAGEEVVWKLWSHVLGYSYAGMDRTLRRLGNRWDVVWHEHEHYQKGKEYVEKGLAAGVFQKLEDGAVLTSLSAYNNIPDTILLKRDGTSLYITQDLALTALKKEIHHADHLVWVIGPDQTLAMRQLFAVCEQLGIGKLSDFTHVSYGYVGLKGADGGFQKMSSRAGTVVLIDDVLDEVRDALEKTYAEKGSILADENNDLFEKLALAAVKFSILKPERTQDTQFDVERSVEVKGDSGIYVMYTYVRTQSILRKAHALGKKVEVPQEVVQGSEVVRMLRLFPKAVERALQDLSVHHVAQYLLELSGAFNAWYATEVILDGGTEEAEKLAVVEAVSLVLKNGLSIMGIRAVDEM